MFRTCESRPTLNAADRIRRAGFVLAGLFLTALSGLVLGACREPEPASTMTTAHSGEAAGETEPGGQLPLSAEAVDRARTASAACEGNPWRLVDGKCSNARTHRRPRSPAGNRATAMAMLRLGQGIPPAPQGGAHATNAAVTVAVMTSKPVDPPSQKSSEGSGPKNRKKHTLAHRDTIREASRAGHWGDEQWNARAQMLPDRSDQRGRHQEPWGWSW